ncbi:unnamed protein product [Commensalibacter communis]|uniref:HEPN domain-containing protein n=1 Tax=Commensalibacter communis TaxID=2972786 RepID=UPI0022FF659F|nr:HEPN domain-containing protein [Commensalibacter communis]CAI3925794.1 unnamed protein product [Commensalibacter communis]CAI3932695.1 unnamed protein product [Commensalibacter communis]CAI3933336.1 unnamed protein product [Commensalibacter communis]
MQLYEMLNELLSLIDLSSFDEATQSTIFFRPYQNHTAFIVSDRNIVQYEQLKSNTLIYFVQNISSNFTIESIDHFTKEQLLHSKINHIFYTQQNQKNFFHDLTSVKPMTIQTITRIEGFLVEQDKSPIQMGCFEIGYSHNLPKKIGTENFIYLKANISQIYDYRMAYQKASSYFLDFSRLLLFIVNDINHNYNIVTNNLLYINKNDFITTILNEYHCYDTEWHLVMSGSQGRTFRKFNLNTLLSSSNYTQLNDLWNFHQQIKNNPKSSEITDIKKRILSASLAVGESIRSEDEKNSLIYTCIAIEALFSFDEGQLFQRSITDKLSDCLAFIIGKDLKHRKEIIKFTKEIYKARSALVHGSLSSKNIDFHRMNTLLRDAIIELLNNPKYKSLKTINQLYDMITDAKLSY